MFADDIWAAPSQHSSELCEVHVSNRACHSQTSFQSNDCRGIPLRLPDRGDSIRWQLVPSRHSRRPHHSFAASRLRASYAFRDTVVPWRSREAGVCTKMLSIRLKRAPLSACKSKFRHYSHIRYPARPAFSRSRHPNWSECVSPGICWALSGIVVVHPRSCPQCLNVTIAQVKPQAA
jgi:hypothetical protein